MINKRKIAAMGLSLTILGTSILGSSTSWATKENTDYFIVNPYESVNWEEYGQYKADFHSHTNESDGRNTAVEMIEDHYAKGFDILAITDHNFNNSTWDRTDRPEDKVYLTSERLAEINAGTDRNGRGMLAIEYSNEQSRSDHLNTFFADFNNERGDTLEENIARAEELGGISHINHPGRYTVARRDLVEGEKISKDPAVYGKYVDLFNKYDSLVGMEIINKKDGDSLSDRILWDSILQETMPENTVENVRESMENGTFYAVAKVAKRELGVDFQAEGPTPVIDNILVDQEEDSITIEGAHYKEIQWIADGEVIATGNTIDLNDYEDEINSYVRAQLLGDGGISFTQPFGVNEDTIANLIDSIEEMDLNKGIKNSLIVKLENAEKSLERGKGNYENMLNAFTNQVKGLTGSQLTEEEAEELLQSVEDITSNLDHIK